LVVVAVMLTTTAVNALPVVFSVAMAAASVVGSAVGADEAADQAATVVLIGVLVTRKKVLAHNILKHYANRVRLVK
jgi:hypothetical protein